MIMTTKSSEQHTQIDNTEKELDILKKWFEEDKENRGFILIKSERKEKVEDEYTFDGNCAIYGNRGIVMAGVVKAIENPDNPLSEMLNRAIEILSTAKKENEQN